MADTLRMPERYPPDFADVLSDTADLREAKKNGRVGQIEAWAAPKVALHLAMQDWSRFCLRLRVDWDRLWILIKIGSTPCQHCNDILLEEKKASVFFNHH